jgi:predicted membrane-bound mannosyltransferase
VGAVFIWIKKVNYNLNQPAGGVAFLPQVQTARETPSISLFSNQWLPGFLLFYTVVTTIVYSCIHYKTPWCLINFHQGIILLAAVGVEESLARLKKKSIRVLFSFLVFAGIVHLGWQSYLGNYKYPADPGNPYVYAHTGMDVYEIAQRVDKLAAVHPDGKNMLLQVFTRQNLWPLPWYFRKYPRQQWWSRVDDRAPLAQVVIATPEMENALVRKIYELPPPGQREMYMRMFDREVDLRPQVEVRGYAAKSLWDRMEEP